MPQMSDDEDCHIGGKEDEADDELMKRCIEFCESREYTSMLSDFVGEHAHEFESAAECKEEEDIEHKLEYVGWTN